MVTVPTYYGTTRAYQIISGSDGIAYNSGSGGLGYTTSSRFIWFILTRYWNINFKWSSFRFRF